MVMGMSMCIRIVCPCCKQAAGSEEAANNSFGVLLSGASRFGICPVCLSGVDETLVDDKAWKRTWTRFYLKEVMKRRLAAAR